MREYYELHWVKVGEKKETFFRLPCISLYTAHHFKELLQLNPKNESIEVVKKGGEDYWRAID